MRLPRKQHGFSFGKMFIILTVIIFLAMVAFKLMPAYIDDYAIHTSIEATVEESSRGGMSQRDIRDGIWRRLDINNISKIKKKDILISRDGYNYLISIDYEERIHFAHNIDLLLTFSHSAEVKAN